MKRENSLNVNSGSSCQCKCNKVRPSCLSRNIAAAPLEDGELGRSIQPAVLGPGVIERNVKSPSPGLKFSPCFLIPSVRQGIQTSPADYSGQGPWIQGSLEKNCKLRRGNSSTVAEIMPCTEETLNTHLLGKRIKVDYFFLILYY